MRFFNRKHSVLIGVTLVVVCSIGDQVAGEELVELDTSKIQTLQKDKLIQIGPIQTTLGEPPVLLEQPTLTTPNSTIQLPTRFPFPPILPPNIFPKIKYPGKVIICYEFLPEDGNKRWSCSEDSASIVFNTAFNRLQPLCDQHNDVADYNECITTPIALYLRIDSPEKFENLEIMENMIQERTQDILSFFEEENGFASSYKATLQKLEEVLNNHEDKIEEASVALSIRKKEVITTFRNEISNMAEEKKGPVAKEIRIFDDISNEINVIMKDYKNAINSESQTFEDIIAGYRADRASEIQFVELLKEISSQASASTYSDIAKLRLELAALSRQEYQRPTSYVEKAKELKSGLKQIQNSYMERISKYRYRKFLEQNNVAQPNLTEKAIQSLEGMIAYYYARTTRHNRAINKLSKGINRRMDALIALNADERTRQSIADAATLESSKNFMENVGQKIEHYRQPLPESQILKLQYLFDKLQRAQSLIEMRSFCAEDVQTEWMKEGCKFLRLEIGKAELFLSRTLPWAVSYNVSKMRDYGVEPVLLDEVLSLMDAGRMAEAVTKYDVAVRLSDQIVEE